MPPVRPRPHHRPTGPPGARPQHRPTGPRGARPQHRPTEPPGAPAAAPIHRPTEEPGSTTACREPGRIIAPPPHGEPDRTTGPREPGRNTGPPTRWGPDRTTRPPGPRPHADLATGHLGPDRQGGPGRTRALTGRRLGLAPSSPGRGAGAPWERRPRPRQSPPLRSRRACANHSPQAGQPSTAEGAKSRPRDRWAGHRGVGRRPRCRPAAPVDGFRDPVDGFRDPAGGATSRPRPAPAGGVTACGRPRCRRPCGRSRGRPRRSSPSPGRRPTGGTCRRPCSGSTGPAPHGPAAAWSSS